MNETTTASTSAAPSQPATPPAPTWTDLLREYRKDRGALEWAKSQRDDRLMVDIMARLLTPTSNVIDIGANLGHVILHILRLAPQGKHYAIEPIPDLAKKLREAYLDLTVKEVALSDRAGEVSFNYCVDKPGWSGFKNWANLPATESKMITVAMQKLDDLLPADYRVDFIKLDVEGAELQVFRGSLGTIKRWKPYIVFEHGCGAADAFGTTPEMIYDFFNDSCGYGVFNLGRWLDGRRPYSREQFARAFRDHHAWNFLACDPAAKRRVNETPVTPA